MSDYDLKPVVSIPDGAGKCTTGWAAVAARIVRRVSSLTIDRPVVVVDTYVGVNTAEILEELGQTLEPELVIDTADLMRSSEEIEDLVAPFLGGDDPIFGRISPLRVPDFFDSSLVENAARQIAAVDTGIVLILGTVAAQFDADIIILADLARWEAQQRQRRHEIANLGADNHTAKAGELYKRSYFVDWRVCDRWKQDLFPRLDYLLDTNEPGVPRLISGDTLLDALQHTSTRPFRVVPFFDPGLWGGHWMEEICGLDRDAPNHAWCFDCVPEENSLLLGFGDQTVEIPSNDLVLLEPVALLGDAVHARFGPEFPIRFDLLDTMGGGNLSLQVHPVTEYIQAHFGLHYTQDESYYILDAETDSAVYLGVKTGTVPETMLADLRSAQQNGTEFDTDRYINQWPARPHDHFLIPAGTIHCSGANTMVLEISATPYIFTFKLWDWGRVGLDGLPRPINIDRGADVIAWERDTEWVERELVSRIEPLAAGDGWREERTGLHQREFIETRRHWFSGTAPHQRTGSVDVLNLVQGAQAIIESPAARFEPFVVHFAETVIIPHAAGTYTIRPHGLAEGTECATIKASVRTGANV